jgi:chromate transporter
MDSAKFPLPTANEPAAAPVGFGKIFTVFLTAGAISFGGGVVAYLREYVVSAEQWMDDEGFLDALELSETLPGLNSVNMSVIIGDRLRGIPGAAMAVAGLMIPGTIVMMTLGVLWAQWHSNPVVHGVLFGIAAAAVGLLLAVTIHLGHRQFARLADIVFIAATFFAVSILRLPLVMVLAVLGTIAVIYYRPRGERSEPHHFRHLRERLRLHMAIWRH